MILPYGNDAHDGTIGWVSVGIIVACTAAFLLSWPSILEHQTTSGIDSTSVSRKQEMSRIDDSLRGTAEDSTARSELAEKPSGESPLVRFGFVPSGPWFPGILTSMFMHAGVWHLLGNMFFFFAFGTALERWFGSAKFAAFYLCGGIFSTLAHVLVGYAIHGRTGSIPLVGASGAIAATMGGYMRVMPGSRIKVFYMLFRIGTFRVAAWLFLGFWFAGQLLSTWLHGGGEGGVAYTAHVGGFLFGFIAAHFLPPDGGFDPAPRPATRFDAPAPWARPSAMTAGEEAWSHLRSDREGAARERFTRMFQDSMRQGDSGLEEIARTLDRIAAEKPEFAFDPLPAFEWGRALAGTRHTVQALRCLRMARIPDRPLPPALSRRRDDIMAELEARLALSATPPAVGASPVAPVGKDWLLR